MAASKFGKQTIGATPDSNAANYEILGSFTNPDSYISVTKLTAYVAGGASSEVARGLIYGDTPSGSTFKATSAEVTVNASAAAAWVDFTFSSPVILTPGGTYWLGLWFGTTSAQIKWYYDTGGSNGYIANTYSSGSDPVGGTFVGGGSNNYSIYATYTLLLNGSAGIASGGAFGAGGAIGGVLQLTGTVTPASQAALGLGGSVTNLSNAQTITGAAGIVSTGAYGAGGTVVPRITLVGISGIVSAEAFPVGTVIHANIIVGSVGIPSGEAFGAEVSVSSVLAALPVAKIGASIEPTYPSGSEYPGSTTFPGGTDFRLIPRR